MASKPPPFAPAKGPKGVVVAKGKGKAPPFVAAKGKTPPGKAKPNPFAK